MSSGNAEFRKDKEENPVEEFKIKSPEGEWDYLALNEHIEKCKKNPRKLKELKVYLENDKISIVYENDIVNIFKQVEDDQKVFQILNNLISFCSRYSIILDNIKHLRRKDIPLIRKKPSIARIKTWASNIYANEISDIDHYFFDYVWAREIFCKDIVFPFNSHDLPENRLLKIMRVWRKDPPDERVLGEFKKILNMVGCFESSYVNKRMKSKTSILQTSLHEIQENPNIFPSEFIHLLIHFGGDFKKIDEWMLHISRTALIKARKQMEIYSDFEKIFFGMKINKWTTELMDDSVNFSHMRARIDMRKSLEIIEEQEKWKEQKEE